MQPLQLKLTAFGPYKQCEVIDFTKLGDQKLFVISGTTGAGKTTIFDGIFYALYGSASGEDRSEVKGLRSHFADDATPTSVDLLFEMRGRTYRVYRQLPYKKAGNKSETPGKVELYEMIDGVETPLVDQQKTTEVATKIQALLGLTKEQFKQIVMLPQGEFQKLLTSDTANKEDILRKIFKTSKYNHMVDRLKEKRDAAQQDLRTAQTMQQHTIHAIKQNLPVREESALFAYIEQPYVSTKQLLALLADERAFYEEALPTQQDTYRAASTQYEKMRDERAASQRLNEDLAKYAQLKVTKQALIAQQPAIETLKQQCDDAKYAQQLEPYDQQYRKAVSALKELRTTEQTYDTALTQAEASVTAAKQQLQQATTARQQVPEIEAELQQLQPLLPVYKRVDALRATDAACKRTLAQAKEQYTKVQATYDEARTQYATEKQTYEQLVHASRTLTDVQQQLFEEKQRAEAYTNYAKVATEVTSFESRLEQATTTLQQATTQYEQLRAAWLGNQAYVLAQELVDGAPCPVCGSTHHEPHAVVQATVNDTQLEQARHDQDAAQRAYYSVMSQYDTAKAQLMQLQQKAQTVGVDVATRYDHERLNVLQQQFNTLNAQYNEAQQLYRTLTDREARMQQLERQRDEAAQTLQAAEQQFIQNDALLQQQLQQLPTQFETKQALEKMIQQLQVQKQQLETQFETARANVEAADKQWSIANNNVVHIQQQLTDAVRQQEEAEAQFKQRVLAHFTDGKHHYTTAKNHIPHIEQFTAQIEQYKQQCYANEQALQANAHYEGKSPIDLTQIDAQIEQLKTTYETLLAQYEQTKRYVQYATKIEEQIRTNAAQIEALEARATEIIHLYDLLRGHNEQKISFERYLQIEYLEQIIEAANERLRPLSNGQFILRRSDRLETRGKQSGLGLDIYDAYTGQTRDVKTMSGGEKFNAALCLALGISDMIQSYNGQVNIDTMFIDEGFGTLDDEALAKAIDTLIELQKSGRMIGLISHVSGLKEAIPAVLEVKKQKEGYSHTAFHMK